MRRHGDSPSPASRHWTGAALHGWGDPQRHTQLDWWQVGGNLAMIARWMEAIGELTVTLLEALRPASTIQSQAASRAQVLDIPAMREGNEALMGFLRQPQADLYRLREFALAGLGVVRPGFAGIADPRPDRHAGRGCRRCCRTHPPTARAGGDPAHAAWPQPRRPCARCCRRAWAKTTISGCGSSWKPWWPSPAHRRRATRRSVPRLARPMPSRAQRRSRPPCASARCHWSCSSRSAP